MLFVPEAVERGYSNQMGQGRPGQRDGQVWWSLKPVLKKVDWYLKCTSVKSLAERLGTKQKKEDQMKVMDPLTT